MLGLSGQVGIAMRAKLAQRGLTVLALSRSARGGEPGVVWLTGAMPTGPEWPDAVDQVISLGPLDAFAEWFARHAPPGVRVVALGSTSRDSKQNSPDADERDVARRLAAAETLLFSTGQAVTVLRPTLIYGTGHDRSLSPLAEFARRRGWMVLPVGGTGLRQPVHVDDVAEAVLRCLERPQTIGHAYDLPGGERLTASAMFQRALRKHAPACHLWHVPEWLFRFAVTIAGGIGLSRVSSRGFLARLGGDQVADRQPVENALGLQLRAFEP